MRSPVRQAIAWIVSDGLTPPTVGNTEPSQIHKFGMSQLRQSAFTTLVSGSSPIRAVPLRWQVSSASAQMSWRGLLSRPVWRLLAYSDEDPPTRRAMVVVDGISGEVVEWFSEENPEDWSSY